MLALCGPGRYSGAHASPQIFRPRLVRTPLARPAFAPRHFNRPPYARLPSLRSSQARLGFGWAAHAARELSVANYHDLLPRTYAWWLKRRDEIREVTSKAKRIDSAPPV